MKISLIIPCFNEEANLQKGVLDKIGNYTKNNSMFTEVIIVNDGSTDRSREIIKNRYLPQFPKFRLITNSHQGKAYAVISGIISSKGDYAMFSDIDLATPIEEASKLIHEAKLGYDIVIGSRNKKRAGAPIFRKIMAFGSLVVKSLLLGLHKIKDTQCGFKLFKTKAALDIIEKLQVFKVQKGVKGSSVSAGFDMEFLFLAEKMKYKIREVSVIWRHVETKNVNFIKDSIESLRDILKIKYFYLTGRYRLR